MSNEQEPLKPDKTKTLFTATKEWIDQNVWDGEDRTGCDGDGVSFTPDGLQDLIDEMLIDLFKPSPAPQPTSPAYEVGGKLVDALGDEWPIILVEDSWVEMKQLKSGIYGDTSTMEGMWFEFADCLVYIDPTGKRWEPVRRTDR